MSGYLQFRHIDWASREIVIPADLAKSSRPRRLPIDKTLWQYLLEARQDDPDGFVFGVKRSPIRQALKTCCQLAKIHPKGVSCHSLRKTFCVGLFRAGTDPEVARDLMGHKSVAITLAVYRTVVGVDRRSAVSGLPWGSGEVVTPEHVLPMSTIFTTPPSGEGRKSLQEKELRKGSA